MRTYSEREVSEIIGRAVERQQAADRGDVAPGLTLDEIERLGREAGIDPAHLRAAAHEVDVAGRTLTRQRSQTSTRVVVERWIDAPLTSTGWEDVVAHLQTALGPHAGAMIASSAGETIQQIGQTYEWTHTSPLGVRTRVAVSPRGGRTRLHMTQLVGLSSPTVEGVGYGAIIAVLAGTIGGGTAAAFAGASGAVAALVVVATFFAAWAVAAPLVAAADRRWRAKKLGLLDALADDLAPLLAAGAEMEGANETPALASASADDAVPEAELSLDAFLDAPEAGGQVPNRQRVR